MLSLLLKRDLRLRAAAGPSGSDAPAAAGLTASGPIAFDSRFWLSTLLLAAILLWPVAVAGHPAYWFDSGEYLTSGTRFLGSLGWYGGERPTFDPTSARSLLYSLITVALSWPGKTLTGVAIWQALMTGFVVSAVLRAFGIAAYPYVAAIGIALAFATPAALFASYAVPDIFAGLLIASLALLALFRDRMSGAMKLALAATAALSVALHASHAPLAICVAGAAIFFGLFISRSGWATKAITVVWLLAPIAIGVSATMAIGFFAFDEVSVAPKRMPFALARSIHEGPARLYLEENCATKRYTICEVFGTQYPDTIEGILWGSKGLSGRATPEQLQRVLDEEPEIVWQSFRARPWLLAQRYLINIGRQVISFGPNEVRTNAYIAQAEPWKFAFTEIPDTEHPTPLVYAIKQISRLAFVLSIIALLLCFRRLDRRTQWAILLVLLGVLANAAICAVFSGVAQRYQARVVWLVALLAIAAVLNARRDPSDRRQA